MPQIQPLFLVPVVGWMQWYLTGKRGRPAREHTPEEVLELAANHAQFAGISRADLIKALHRAQLNVNASNSARLLSVSYTGTRANKQ